MSERHPFYKKPLLFSVVSRGSKHSLGLVFNQADILHPSIILNNVPIEGELTLSPMYHGNVETTNVGLKIKDNEAFADLNGTNKGFISFNLCEFAPFFIGLFSLGNLGVIPTKKKTEITRVKRGGFLPRIIKGHSEIAPVIKYELDENKKLRQVSALKPTRTVYEKGAFSCAIEDGQIVTKNPNSLIIDAESTYYRVIFERNSSSLIYFIQMIWLINRIKKMGKSAKS